MVLPMKEDIATVDIQASNADTAGGNGRSSHFGTVRSSVQPLGYLRHIREYATVGLLIGLVLLFWATTKNFMTVRNIQNLTLVQAVTGTMTLGVMLPLVVGEFDVSVGYMLGALVMAGAFVAGLGAGTITVVLVMVGGGALVGLVNGLLTVRARISSFIGTLGVGIILEGVTQGISNGEVLYEGIPKSIMAIGAGYVGGLAIAVWAALAIAAMLFYVLEYTPLGRRWYAIGGSEKVAFLAGLRTGRLKILAFVWCGILVGVAGIFALGQSGAANPGFGPALLLPAYAAAFLGVTTYRSGFYNVVGSVVAILLLAVGFNGLSLLGVPFWAQPVFNGGVLIIALMLARAEARRVKTLG